MAHGEHGLEKTKPETLLINDSAVLDFREDQAKQIREMAGLSASSTENDKPPLAILRSNPYEDSSWVGSRPRHGDGRMMSRDTILEQEEIQLAKAISLSAIEDGDEEKESTNDEKDPKRTPCLDVSLAMPYVSDMTEDEELDLAMALSASRAETTEAGKDDDESEKSTTSATNLSEIMTQERPSGTTVDWREHSRGLVMRHRPDDTKDSDI